MQEEVLNLKLPRSDLGQIGECLQLRLEAWRNSELYLREGRIVDPMVVDCTKLQEATYFVSIYERLVRIVEEKLSSTRS